MFYFMKLPGGGKLEHLFAHRSHEQWDGATSGAVSP